MGPDGAVAVAPADIGGPSPIVAATDYAAVAVAAVAAAVAAADATAAATIEPLFDREHYDCPCSGIACGAGIFSAAGVVAAAVDDVVECWPMRPAHHAYRQKYYSLRWDCWM